MPGKFAQGEEGQPRVTQQGRSAQIRQIDDRGTLDHHRAEPLKQATPCHHRPAGGDQIVDQHDALARRAGVGMHFQRRFTVFELIAFRERGERQLALLAQWNEARTQRIRKQGGEDEATRFKPGDAVFASIFDQGTGSLAEFAVVPQHLAAPKPANLDFVQAASIPMVGLTSWQALKERAQLKQGQKVFIPAGSGGIGTFAIQLAKHLGAHVGTTTSTGNIPLVKRLGADEVIDYKKQAFEQVLRGYHVVLGTIREDALEKSVSILKPGGQIISLIGPLDTPFAHTRKLNFMLRLIFGLMSRKIIRKASAHGAGYSFLFVRPDGEQLDRIGELLSAGHVSPVIDKAFPWEQATQALAYLAQGHAKGKVVVQIK